MGRPKNFSREEVLDKAIPLFWKQGFADTSLQDLERATGVNKSGLYSEFESKEDLYLESLRHYLVTHDAKILNLEPYGWHNIESFFRVVQSCPDGENGCFAINSMRELAVVPEQAHDIISKNVSSLRRLFAKNIVAERTKMETETIADIAVTMFTGFCLEQNLRPKKAASSRKITDLMKVLRSL